MSEVDLLPDRIYCYEKDASPEENIALALYAIANEIQALGNGNVNRRGAIEGLGLVILDNCSLFIAGACNDN